MNKDLVIENLLNYVITWRLDHFMSQFLESAFSPKHGQIFKKYGFVNYDMLSIKSIKNGYPVSVCVDIENCDMEEFENPEDIDQIFDYDYEIRVSIKYSYTKESHKPTIECLLIISRIHHSSDDIAIKYERMFDLLGSKEMD